MWRRRPPSELLEEQIPCGFAANTAIKTCEIVAAKCGYRVMSKTGIFLFLMPVPKAQVLPCLVSPVSARVVTISPSSSPLPSPRGGYQPATRTPSGAATSPTATTTICNFPSTRSAHGITLEIVSDLRMDDSLTIVAQAGRCSATEAFVKALRPAMAALCPGPAKVYRDGNQQLEEDSAFALLQRDPSKRFRLEAEAYYRTCKVLSDPGTGPGKALADFARDLTAMCADASSSDMQCRPLPTCAIQIDKLLVCVDQHLCQIPSTSASSAGGRLSAERRRNLAAAQKLKPWLRTSVERCLFGRVGGAVWQFYVNCSGAEDSSYICRAEALAVLPDCALLDDLEVRSEFAGFGTGLQEAKCTFTPSSQSTTVITQATTYTAGKSSLCSVDNSIGETPPRGSDDFGSKEDVGENDRFLGDESCGSRAGEAETKNDVFLIGDVCEGESRPDETSLSFRTRSDWHTAKAVYQDVPTEGASPRSTGSGSLYSFGSVYARAAASLSKVEASLSAVRGCAPREALEALEVAQLEMKADALEVSAGRLELLAMDDILPIFVFVLLRSSLRKPFACARLLRDALSQDERLDGRGQAVLLLESAAKIVAFFDWKAIQAATNPKGRFRPDGAVQESPNEKCSL